MNGCISWPPGLDLHKWDGCSPPPKTKYVKLGIPSDGRIELTILQVAFRSELFRGRIYSRIMQDRPEDISADNKKHCILCTYHMLPMTRLPLGIKYRSLYTSSSVALCGTPNGVTIIQRRDSLMIALMYGNESRSLNLGNRSEPTTSCNSRCARRCISGYSVIARKNVSIVEGDYKCFDQLNIGPDIIGTLHCQHQLKSRASEFSSMWLELVDSNLYMHSQQHL